MPSWMKKAKLALCMLISSAWCFSMPFHVHYTCPSIIIGKQMICLPLSIAAAPRSRRTVLEMRDRSTVNLREGDVVTVTEDVISGGVNLKGLQGRVIYAWEKCEVDPTCCCAELCMDDASVQVLFEADSVDSPLSGGHDLRVRTNLKEDLKAYLNPEELAVLMPTPLATKLY